MFGEVKGVWSTAKSVRNSTPVLAAAEIFVKLFRISSRTTLMKTDFPMIFLDFSCVPIVSVFGPDFGGFDTKVIGQAGVGTRTSNLESFACSC